MTRAVASACVVLFSWLPVAVGAQSSATVWSQQVRISEPGTFSWFPDVAVDVYGSPHVVWDASVPRGERRNSALLHTQRVDGEWTHPFDVVADTDVESNIWRGSVAADDAGFLFVQEQVAIVYVRKVTARPGGLTDFHRLRPIYLADGSFYMGALGVGPGGSLHVLFDMLRAVKGGDDPNAPPALSDVYYRRSDDRGVSWSKRVNLSETPVGETREKIEVDARGVVYVSWDEGWDRPTWYGEPERGVLRISHDGGRSWSPRIAFEEPDRSNAQLAVAGDGKGGVLAVWRPTANDDAAYFSWSSDDGASWSAAKTIPGLLPRLWSDTPFDAYDVAADSAGTIHLLAVGRREEYDPQSQLYHLAWNGTAWSAPQIVDGSPGWPEYPRLVASRGNRLHATWFVRDQLHTEEGRYQVWYTEATTPAPALPLPPAPSSITTGMVANTVGGFLALALAVVVVRARRREALLGRL